MNRNKRLMISFAVLTLAIAFVTPSVIVFLNANSFGTAATGSLPQPAYGSNWQPAEVVSTESDANSFYPSLDIGRDGTVHVAWHDPTNYGGAGADDDVFYKRYEPGIGWTTTEVISTESTGTSRYPSLGVGADGTVHIAWHDATDYSGAGTDYDVLYRRFEPGIGWTATEVVSTESTSHSSNPSLGVGADGVVHIAWHDITNYNGSGADFDVFYKRYEPGVGWTVTEVVSTESTLSSAEASLGVGADGTVHIAWHDATDYSGAGTDYDVFYKRYELASGWTTTEVISTESTDHSYNPALDVGADGTVHIAWHDLTDYDAGVDIDVLYRRFEPGIGWTATEVVSTESSGDSYTPSVGVGVDGTLHTVWYDATDYGGAGADDDVLYRRFEPGIGWTATEVVSTESTDHSRHPSLGVGADGTVYVVWHDYTGTADVDIFYTTNAFSAVEPSDLNELLDTSRRAHLQDLYGAEKSAAYLEIQSVSGYSAVRGLLESRGYDFQDYNISIVKGTVLNQAFSGLVYSHWSNLTSDGTAALLVTALMDDGVNFMLGVCTNILPVEYTHTGPYIIVNAMPYSFIKLHFYDTINDRVAVWGYSWQESNPNPDWFWNVYSWWRTYTRHHYTWYYYQPWRCIWHYAYWKNWHYN